MEWNNEKVLLLIEEYRRCPELWDPKNKDYKNRNKKKDAWNKLSKTSGVNIMEVQRKIRNMCSHFYAELKKIKSTKSSGSGSENVYQSKWFAFQSLRFMADKNTKQPSIDTVMITDEEGLITVNNHESEDESIKSKSEDNTSEIIPHSSEETEDENKKECNKIQFLSARKMTLNKKRRGDAIVDEAYGIMKEMYNNKQKRDEFTTFGEYVGYKLRKLDSDYAKATVQHLISDILFKAEIGTYNHPSYTHSRPST